MSKIQEVMMCLDTLSQAAQDEIKDKLMISSENEWHDVKQLYRRFEADEIVDFNETDYSWYREDDLEESGYIHESSMVDYICNNPKYLNEAMNQMKLVKINYDTIQEVFNTLTDEQKDQMGKLYLNDLTNAYLS